MIKDDKFCQGHIKPEYFPITYTFCPYCGEELELVPEMKEIIERKAVRQSSKGGQNG